jgi:hypothetical protein
MSTWQDFLVSFLSQARQIIFLCLLICIQKTFAENRILPLTSKLTPTTFSKNIILHIPKDNAPSDKQLAKDYQ